MGGDHRSVVHFVDLVARQNQHIDRVMRADVLEILKHGVGRAPIPMVAQLLLRRDDLHELAEFASQITPAPLQVLDQGLGLVLGEHADLPDSRIDAVGEHEIDDAELSAKGRRRLTPVLGESFQSLASAARQDDGKRATGQSADIASGHSA
jgi:hypothetical protein